MVVHVLWLSTDDQYLILLLFLVRLMFLRSGKNQISSCGFRYFSINSHKMFKISVYGDTVCLTTLAKNQPNLMKRWDVKWKWKWMKAEQDRESL